MNTEEYLKSKLQKTGMESSIIEDDDKITATFESRQEAEEANDKLPEEIQGEVGSDANGGWLIFNKGALRDNAQRENINLTDSLPIKQGEYRNFKLNYNPNNRKYYTVMDGKKYESSSSNTIKRFVDEYYDDYDSIEDSPIDDTYIEDDPDLASAAQEVEKEKKDPDLELKDKFYAYILRTLHADMYDDIDAFLDEGNKQIVLQVVDDEGLYESLKDLIKRKFPRDVVDPKDTDVFKTNRLIIRLPIEVVKNFFKTTLKLGD